MNFADQELQQTIAEFIRAYNAGDVDQIMKVYADDFVDMPDGEPTLYGAHAHEDTAARLRDTFRKFTGTLTVDVEQSEIAGDWAFDRGTLRVELHPKGAGQPVQVERRFLEIWKRDGDGRWRVAQAMDNRVRGSTESSLDFRD